MIENKITKRKRIKKNAMWKIKIRMVAPIRVIKI
jgi:hypothetical protein